MNQRDLTTFNCSCENALIDKPFHDAVFTWIEENEILFSIAEKWIHQLQTKIVNVEETKYILLFHKDYLQAKGN